MLQMLIPLYENELKGKKKIVPGAIPSHIWLNYEWYRKFLYGEYTSNTDRQGLVPGTDVLRQAIIAVENKNKNIGYVCETLGLDLPISNTDPHSLVLFVKRRHKKSANDSGSKPKSGVLIVPNNTDARFLKPWLGLKFIPGYEEENITEHRYLKDSFDLKVTNNYCWPKKIMVEKFKAWMPLWHKKNLKFKDCVDDAIAVQKKAEYHAHSMIMAEKKTVDKEHLQAVKSMHDTYDGFQQVIFRTDLCDIPPDISSFPQLPIRGSHKALITSMHVERDMIDDSNIDNLTTNVICAEKSIAICDVIPTLEETIYVPAKDTQMRSSNPIHALDDDNENFSSKYEVEIDYRSSNNESDAHSMSVKAICRCERCVRVVFFNCDIYVLLFRYQAINRPCSCTHIYIYIFIFFTYLYIYTVTCLIHSGLRLQSTHS